ncbi:hypothetical protein AMS59_12740 [Lysinibacillus sp. FJAT-14745]|uniref:hypothetical protein n=1 Tax=Lysinibacillus sp. FJAT-14745 TaxID=1704289 RepID=UPI0006ABA9D3|nr:hypothetical protein [Lysinibacillus sp. FJAT-14745]KOP78675.1 hypothetical protein AMS59_12740 [Lysinibacillus sp. FJAT-14745]
MPIINKNIQVVFGTGDILARIGCKSDRASGVIQFIENEPMPIGQFVEPNDDIMEIDEAPVTFIFNKIESIDAVIFQLQKLKDIMGVDDKYEWTASGRIVEKE